MATAAQLVSPDASPTPAATITACPVAPALRISRLDWWVSDRAVLDAVAVAAAADGFQLHLTLEDVCFCEYKNNGKSRGTAFVLFPAHVRDHAPLLAACADAVHRTFPSAIVDHVDAPLVFAVVENHGDRDCDCNCDSTATASTSVVDRVAMFKVYYATSMRH
ncbi:hypothetical protein HDU83_001154 [Entophlyctis luteolus]|nr:hypothetical protein HDU83_001154 [Entophlyctis luteolus]